MEHIQSIHGCRRLGKHENYCTFRIKSYPNTCIMDVKNLYINHGYFFFSERSKKRNTRTKHQSLLANEMKTFQGQKV